jgi:dolichol kinase
MGKIPDDEIRRKLFHMLALIYVAAYWYLNRAVVLVCMGVVIALVVVFEHLRLKSTAFNKRLLSLLGSVHRDEETGKISALPGTLSGSFLTMLLFSNRSIVIVSLLFLVFGDAAAALVGRSIGKCKIMGCKTLEGSIACLVVCFAVGLLFLPTGTAVLAAVMFAVLELIPWPYTDNFWLPVVSAGLLTLMNAATR